jgi:hypothetical protein
MTKQSGEYSSGKNEDFFTANKPSSPSQTEEFKPNVLAYIRLFFGALGVGAPHATTMPLDLSPLWIP